MTQPSFKKSGTILIGHSGKDHEQRETLSLAMANRHGLITGATGTGKSVTVQSLAESFSAAGVAVFLADVKGDLSGLAAPRDKVSDPRLSVVFHDILGQRGHPLRICLTDMGPMLLAQLLGLTEAQEGAVNIAFRMAREGGVVIKNLNDFREWLMQIELFQEEIKQRLGTVPTATLNAIRRRLLVLEEEGSAEHFAAPSFDIHSLLGTGEESAAPVNILAAEQLLQHPRTYAFTLMWLMSSLARELDEIGDSDRPRLVFFFDEAHLLFRNAPPVLVDKIEQVIRLIRSKGVGIYFATQHPNDIPARILAQLSHKVIHSLRSFTPQDRRVIRAIAEGMPADAGFEIEREISALGVGEAIVSMLGADGRPQPARRMFMRTPDTRLGPISEAERREIIGGTIPLQHPAENVDQFSNLGPRPVALPVTCLALPRASLRRDCVFPPEQHGLAYILSYTMGQFFAHRTRKLCTILRNRR